MNKTFVSRCMTIPPYGVLALVNTTIGVVGLIIQIIGLALMISLIAKGEWGK